MIKTFLYKLLFGFINLVSRLPFWVLHGVSDFLYLVIFYIVGYRKKMVYNNMSKAFPEKNDAEIKKIRKQFYHHFSDLLIESIKSSTMSIEEFRKRYRVTNWSKLDEVLSTGESVIVLSPHTGNWEWVFSLVDQIPCTVLAIYQKLSNPYMDGYIKDTRQRYGAVMVPMKETYAKVLKAMEDKEQTLTWFAADQACKPEKAQWIRFLNQDATFHRGYENLAKQTGQKVLFLDIRKIKRSYYELEFTLISENPRKAEEGFIVEKFAQLTEKRIKSDPPYWLWTHNRWKHKQT